MTWRATYLPDSENDPSIGGLDTLNDALQYVEASCCSDCIDEARKNGYLAAILDTSCGCEWHIEEEREYILTVWKGKSNSDDDDIEPEDLEQVAIITTDTTECLALMSTLEDIVSQCMEDNENPMETIWIVREGDKTLFSVWGIAP